MKAIESAPLRVRLWGQDFNLLASFEGEHAVKQAEAWIHAEHRDRVHATVDHHGERWSGSLEAKGCSWNPHDNEWLRDWRTT